MEVKEPAIAYGKREYSIEEYLDMENASTERHEYYQGEIFAMSGAKRKHLVISKNLMVSLGGKLKGKPCQPYGSDGRIHIEKNTLFTYPDIFVICGDMISRNDDDMNFLNPTIIVEILSRSTRNYDKGTKFKLYQDIATLKEYIMVDSEAVAVQAWNVNENGTWMLKEYNKLTQTLRLPTIQVSLKLNTIYDGINFDD
jgi:Uma2 family endonuclease